MYKVGGVTSMSSALGLMSSAGMAAASEEKPTVTTSVDELSLYTTPQQKLHYVEPKVGQVEQGVATMRKMAEPSFTWCQGVYGAVKPSVSGAVQLGQDGYAYLRDPPAEFYPRAGVIGFAGILGLFLARGSRVKRLLYPAGLVTVGASLYYPQQAVAIAKNTGDTLYDWTLQAYVAMEKLVKSKPAPKAIKAEDSEEEKPSEEQRE